MWGWAVLLRDSGYATCKGTCSSAPRLPESDRASARCSSSRRRGRAQGGEFGGVQRPSAIGDGAAQAGCEQRFRTGAQSCRPTHSALSNVDAPDSGSKEVISDIILKDHCQHQKRW